MNQKNINLSNTEIEGLPINESAKFCNYFHFREPQLNEEKSLLFKANFDKAIDFLDPIDEDQPKGMLIFYEKININ